MGPFPLDRRIYSQSHSALRGSAVSELPKVFLARHGETEWSLSGQHTGSTDIPLTAHGEQDGLRLRDRLRDIPFAAVFISPRRRAIHTAALAGFGGQAQIDPDLAEWDY